MAIYEQQNKIILLCKLVNNDSEKRVKIEATRNSFSAQEFNFERNVTLQQLLHKIDSLTLGVVVQIGLSYFLIWESGDDHNE